MNDAVLIKGTFRVDLGDGNLGKVSWDPSMDEPFNFLGINHGENYGGWSGASFLDEEQVKAYEKICKEKLEGIINEMSQV